MGTKREVNVSSPFIWLLILGVIIWNKFFLVLQVGWTGESADTATTWVLELYWGAETSEIGGKKKNKHCKYNFWKLRWEICYNPCITWSGSRPWSWSGEGVSGGVFLTHFWFALAGSALFYLNICSCKCLLFISWNFVYTHIYACTQFYLTARTFIYLLHVIFLFY